MINTERLILRKFTAADISNVYAGLSHPRVIKYYGVSFHTLEATQEQMDWFANLEKNDTGIWWAVCDKNTLTFYGGGGLNALDSKHRKAEIGFWLLPEYWGRGYMQEAMNAIIKYAFEELNLHRIEGYVDHDNANCKKGLAKMNFQYEGTMRDCEIKNDTFVSVDIYARLNL